MSRLFFFFFFQAEDGIRDAQESRGLGDVYKRQSMVEAGPADMPPPEEDMWPSEDPEPLATPQAHLLHNLYEPIEILENFSMVAPGIYRSSFPKKKHYPFLKRLRIKTILFLAHEEYPEAHIEWMQRNGLQLAQHGVSGNKEPFVEIDPDVIVMALSDPVSYTHLTLPTKRIV
eukprot:TRINITY_DN24512_c0_g1_i2.p1 TRINITY_DN24512_c0_g1~~TRINITY_DN24512_c0_g1_i2.p1  ORF type:complete len:173 (+),score=59.41 TRINITY_DN24512_c0_g1_i2:90-608(+)